jgi:hypothetical protein
MLKAHSSNVYQITLEGPATGNSTPKKQAISLDERAYKTGRVGGKGGGGEYKQALGSLSLFSKNKHSSPQASVTSSRSPYTESLFFKH